MSAGAKQGTGVLILTSVVRVVLFLVLFGALLFGVAGRWDVLAFWAYLGVFFVGFGAALAVVLRTDPTLMQERMKPGPGGKDPSLRLWSMLLFVAHWVIAALDVGRHHWSDTVPVALQGVAFVALLGSLSLATWAMSANRFYSSDARIQRDRGHHVVTTGPYAYIRHPGYAGALLMGLTSPLALGSWWSFVPMLPAGVLIFRRLFLEERMLREELEGYSDYAQRVRCRLIPHLW